MNKVIKAQNGAPTYNWIPNWDWKSRYIQGVKDLQHETGLTSQHSAEEFDQFKSGEQHTPTIDNPIDNYNNNVTFVADYNREHNTGFIDRNSIFEYEKSKKPGLNMHIKVPAMYGTATGAGNTQIYDPKNLVDSTVGAELSSVTIPATFALAGGAFGTIPQLLTNGAFYIGAARNLSSPDGFQKTKNLLAKRQYSKAVLSGLGDALDASIVLSGSNSINSAIRNLSTLRKLSALKTIPYQEVKTIGYSIPTWYKSGGKIHIKKENRGKFTSYCGGKVTSECIARGKNSPNPAIRKRATFAANARKWKHANGGNIPNWFKHD